MPRRKTHSEYIEDLRQAHPDVVCLEAYINGTTKILHRCKRCGHERLATPDSVLASKTGCPYCAKNLKYTTETFTAKLKEINSNVTVIGKYVNSHAPILVQCDNCGHKWNAKPASLLQNHRCPSCVFNQTSFFEQCLRWTLVMIFGEESVLARDKKAIGKELDVCVPSLDLAFEPGSWAAGHKDKLSRDMAKRKLCADKGIRLITIYDSYPIDEEPPFLDDCLVYPGDLGQASFSERKHAVEDALFMANVNAEIADGDFDLIEAKARDCCRRKTHEEFIAELEAVNGSIEIVSRFVSMSEKVKAKCKACGTEWFVKPYSLLRGIGCPTCGRKQAARSKTRTSEEFEQKLSLDNPTVKLIEPYRKGAERVLVECRKCGYRWKPLAYSLVGKYAKACPHCGAVKAGNAARGMTRATYIEKLSFANPDVELLGEYVNSKTKTLFKCKICSQAWEARPYSVLQGHGCPNWRKHHKE